MNLAVGSSALQSGSLPPSTPRQLAPLSQCPQHKEDLIFYRVWGTPQPTYSQLLQPELAELEGVLKGDVQGRREGSLAGGLLRRAHDLMSWDLSRLSSGAQCSGRPSHREQARPDLHKPTKTPCRENQVGC